MDNVKNLPEVKTVNSTDLYILIHKTAFKYGSAILEEYCDGISDLRVAIEYAEMMRDIERHTDIENTP